MKIDIKMIIIVVLSLLFIGFIIFGGDGVDSDRYERERELLQNTIDSIRIEKGLIDVKVENLENSYNDLINNYDSLNNINTLLSSELNELNKIIEYKNAEFNKSKKKIKELNDKLEDMKNNPPNRVGDELINNLRNKFN